MKLGVKIGGGYGIVALIVLIVGGVGLWGVSQIYAQLETLSSVNLPAVESIGVLAKEAESIRVVVRTLLNPMLKEEDYKRQFANITTAREKYGVAQKLYDSLPRTKAEDELYKQFTSAWSDYRNANNLFLQYVKELEATQIKNPQALARSL